VRQQGIANFAEAMAGGNEVGQKFAAQVLTDLRGEGLCGKDFYDKSK
jgi:hypothetical protein